MENKKKKCKHKIIPNDPCPVCGHDEGWCKKCGEPCDENGEEL
jgi:hypothetical protein